MTNLHDEYWFYNPFALIRNQLLVTEEAFARQIGPSLSGEIAVGAWYMVLDGESFEVRQAGAFLERAAAGRSESRRAASRYLLAGCAQQLRTEKVPACSAVDDTVAVCNRSADFRIYCGLSLACCRSLCGEKTGRDFAAAEPRRVGKSGRGYGRVGRGLYWAALPGPAACLSAVE